MLHRPARQGLGPAYLAGFRRALAGGATYVFEMDADFSHDPADLGRLLAAVEDGADVALGSRYVDGGGVEDWGLVRRVVSRGGCTYARTVLGLAGARPDRRLQVLPPRGARGDRARHACARTATRFQIELTLRAIEHGFIVREVPIVFRDRQHGHSKMSPWIALEAIVVLPALRHSGRRADGR